MRARLHNRTFLYNTLRVIQLSVLLPYFDIILEFKMNYNHLNLNNYFEIEILTLKRLIRNKKKFFIIL